MDEERQRQNKKEPTGMSRDEFAKMLAGVINDSYDLAFKLVKRECNESSSHIC